MTHLVRKNIHQIWLKDDFLPENIKYNINFCENHYVWVNQNIWKTLLTTKKDLCSYWSIQENDYIKLISVVRLLLLKKFGGLYLDPKIRLLNNKIFDDNLNGFIVCTNNKTTPLKIETTDISTFDVFGSSKSNILLSKILMNIKNNKHENITEVYRKTIVDNQENIKYLTINEFNNYIRICK
jgi:mannosyltransferase OCH1-like enzyme